MFVARDKDGSLYLYIDIDINMMTKLDDCWVCPFSSYMIELDNKLFPNVKWVDSKPTEVELIIKNKV